MKKTSKRSCKKSGRDSVEYLWKVSSDEKLQFWNRESSQRYLTNPTPWLPVSAARGKVKGAKISAPELGSYDPLVQRGVVSAGVALHCSGYYHYRKAEKYHVALYAIGGAFKVKFGGQTHILKKGMFMLIPRGCRSDESVAEKKSEILWFNIKDSAVWKADFGSDIKLGKSKYFQQILSFSSLYESMIYNTSSRDAFLLDMLSACILRTIQLEARAGIDTYNIAKSVENAVLGVRRNPNADWSCKNAASKAGFTAAAFDRQCICAYGMRFAKIVYLARMDRAKELLARGDLSLADIASKTGYSTAFALSKAFKRHFGMPPCRFSCSF